MRFYGNEQLAEAHGKQMPVRQALGAALPLAGVGCAIRRDTLAAVARLRDGDPFDATSLTEDYELGLAVSRAGGRVAFVRAIDPAGQMVAVRGHFPATIDAAVRQKARWMTGIALAGWDRTGWGGRASATEWWMRMRDRRAILAVIALAAAYIGLVATASVWLLGAAGRVSSPLAPGIEWLLLVTAGLLVWRAILRIGWVAASYGPRDALLALPRLFVGNVIAMLAARRAVGHYLRLLRGRAPRWDKTAHRFPAHADLVR